MVAEECICLDTKHLRKNGYLDRTEPTTVAMSCAWPDGGVINVLLDINMGDAVYGPRILLKIDGVQNEQLIYLESTRPNFGGTRWWFICLTGTRCSKLYLPYGARDFQSREALNLTYKSQHLGPVWRLQRRAKQLRATLDLAAKSVGFPDKPKGMWHRTYQTKRNQAIEAEYRALATMNNWMERHYAGTRKGTA
jgi:hypothetical protein